MGPYITVHNVIHSSFVWRNKESNQDPPWRFMYRGNWSSFREYWYHHDEWYDRWNTWLFSQWSHWSHQETPSTSIEVLLTKRYILSLLAIFIDYQYSTIEIPDWHPKRTMTNIIELIEHGMFPQLEKVSFNSILFIIHLNDSRLLG